MILTKIEIDRKLLDSGIGLISILGMMTNSKREGNRCQTVDSALTITPRLLSMFR